MIEPYDIGPLVFGEERQMFKESFLIRGQLVFVELEYELCGSVVPADCFRAAIVGFIESNQLIARITKLITPRNHQLLDVQFIKPRN